MHVNRTQENVSADLFRGVGYGLLIIIIIFVNAMLLFAYKIRVPRKRRISDFFMVNLAVSGILTTIFVITVVAYIKVTGNEEFIGLRRLCYIQTYFGLSLRILDVAITTAITIDRFVALWKPIFYRTKVKLFHGIVVSSMIWTLSLFMGLFQFSIDDGITHSVAGICTANWEKFTAYIVLCLAYLQLVIVLFCYIGIYICIRAFVNRQKAMAKSQEITYKQSKEEYVTPNPRRNTYTCSQPCDATQNNLKGAKTNNSFEIEVAEKICEISAESLKRALEGVTDNSHVEVETSFQLLTKRHSISSTPNLFESSYKPFSEKSSFDLRLKTAVKQFSHNSYLQENLKKNKDRMKMSLRKTRSVDEDMLSLGVHKHHMSQTSIEESPQFGREKFKIYCRKEKAYNMSIYIQEKFRKKRCRKESNLQSYWSESERFAKIMGIVVLIFYISWLPVAISINISLIGHNETANTMLRICYNLSLLSNLAIPIAYSVMCKPYRIGYKLIWKRLRPSCSKH